MLYEVITNHGIQPKTPIESVTKFCQIAREMPIAHCVVGAMESILDIAQDDIEPFEHIAISITAINIGDHLVMRATSSRYTREATQAICKHRAARPDNRITSYNVCYTKLLRICLINTRAKAMSVRRADE